MEEKMSREQLIYAIKMSVSAIYGAKLIAESRNMPNPSQPMLDVAMEFCVKALLSEAGDFSMHDLLAWAHQELTILNLENTNS